MVSSGCSQEADIDQREAVVEKYAKEAIFKNNYWREKMRTPRWSSGGSWTCLDRFAVSSGKEADELTMF